jgi:hypothetical protein
MYIIINVMFNLVYSLDGTLESRRAGRRVATPDTWEVALSSGADKRTAWERLLSERKLGALALLRNLRNLREAGVSDELVLGALRSMKTERALPFRFIAAARYAPQWEETLEQAMFGSVAAQEKLKGKTVLLVDVSGSMIAPLSRRSEMLRTDAAYGLAILLREICDDVAVYSFSITTSASRRVAASPCAMPLTRASRTMARIWARRWKRSERITTESSSLPTSRRMTASRTRVGSVCHQCGQLQEWRGLRQVDAYRRLERVGRRVHPRAGVLSLELTTNPGRENRRATRGPRPGLSEHTFVIFRHMKPAFVSRYDWGPP